MGSDLGIVLRWWGTLFLVGAAAFPLTKRLFSFTLPMWKASHTSEVKSGWWDNGYLFSKAVGLAVTTWIVYALGTIRVLPFTSLSIIISLLILFLGGFLLNIKCQKSKRSGRKSFKFTAWSLWLIIFEELFFFAALLFWAWIKGHEPSIRGLEKFMDFGFMKSILNTQFFPPSDMWYAGFPINYYYFGHLITAVLTQLSGLDLAYTFNLMLATLFALTLTMSFSIGVQLFRRKSQNSNLNDQQGKKTSYWDLGFGIWDLTAGALTAFLVTLAGNLQTVYAFTRGYTGEDVKPLWQLLWGGGEFISRLSEGLNRYWYPNATRFIPLTIHEFPSYSFVVSDVHGHVLSIPFVLLAIALLIALFSGVRDPLTKIVGRTNTTFWQGPLTLLGFYGFLVGVLLMTNALDGPIYFGLLVVALIALIVHSTKCKVQSWKTLGAQLSIVSVAAGVTSLPFLAHFKSFVNGLAINCPPGFLTDTKIGPLIFEGVEKCQKSPLWMWLLLWGFFLYCGIWLIISKFKIKTLNFKLAKEQLLNTQLTHVDKLLLVFFFFSVALIIFPEFFYFKDIYPAHFRSNTMFKLGYQAFILFSIVSGYAIVQAISDKRKGASKKIFFLFLVPQLFLVSIYPIFSVRSYFNGLREYEGLYGLSWLKREYPDDWRAIAWLNRQISSPTSPRLRGVTMTGLPVIVEADGDSYTDYGRFSTFTGLATIIGWPVHEWLWRGTYDVVAPRREEVRLIYESGDTDLTRQILRKYHVSFVVVGTLERRKYQELWEDKFAFLGQQVYRIGDTVIYRVSQ